MNFPELIARAIAHDPKERREPACIISSNPVLSEAHELYKKEMYELCDKFDSLKEQLTQRRKDFSKQVNSLLKAGAVVPKEKFEASSGFEIDDGVLYLCFQDKTKDNDCDECEETPPPDDDEESTTV